MQNTADPYETLTAEQLDYAAADLRNSSMVLDMLGRCIGTLFDGDCKVCAVGAVELATTRRLTRSVSGTMLMIPVSPYNMVMDSLQYRAQNAIRVLSTVVPGDLCQNCCDAKIAEHLPHKRTCSVCFGQWEPRDPWDRVTHFNDNHVTEDETLHRYFEVAADRALLAAAEKRSLVSGERILVTA